MVCEGVAEGLKERLCSEVVVAGVMFMLLGEILLAASLVLHV